MSLVSKYTVVELKVILFNRTICDWKESRSFADII